MEQAPQLTELVDPVPGGRVFEREVRAGLADADPSGRVRLDALARWLQDVAYEDVEDADLVSHATWVVRRLRLSVRRFPHFGERLSVRTFCSGLGKMWAERRTSISGADGGADVEAVALWVHLDPSSLRPRPFDDDERAVYASSAAGRQVKARLRHPAPGPDAARERWWFRAADLDVAEHVNNAAYWEPVEERLQDGGPAPEAFDGEIEFRGAAQAGEAVVLRQDGWLWVASPGGEVHASVALGVSPSG